MNMKYEDAHEFINKMIEKAKTADSIARDIIGGPYGKGDFQEFTNKGAIFSYEYNDACHCHPEWRTKEYLIPSEWIDAIVTKYVIPPEENIIEPILSEYDNESEDTSLLIELLNKHKVELEAKEIEAKRLKQEQEKIEEEELKILNEKREREEFERLSKKFL